MPQSVKLVTDDNGFLKGYLPVDETLEGVYDPVESLKIMWSSRFDGSVPSDEKLNGWVEKYPFDCLDEGFHAGLRLLQKEGKKCSVTFFCYVEACLNNILVKNFVWPKGS